MTVIMEMSVTLLYRKSSLLGETLSGRSGDVDEHRTESSSLVRCELVNVITTTIYELKVDTGNAVDIWFERHHLAADDNALGGWIGALDESERNGSFAHGERVIGVRFGTDGRSSWVSAPPRSACRRGSTGRHHSRKR